MKKFLRHRSYLEIKALCSQQKVPLNDGLYVKRGWDTIVVGFGGDRGHAIYSAFNGKFFGTTPKGVRGIPNAVHFDSSSTRYENAKWFQALLSFFYVEKT